MDILYTHFQCTQLKYFSCLKIKVVPTRNLMMLPYHTVFKRYSNGRICDITWLVNYTNVYSRAYKNYGTVLSTCVTTERNCRSDSFVLILTSLCGQLQKNILKEYFIVIIIRGYDSAEVISRGGRVNWVRFVVTIVVFTWYYDHFSVFSFGNTVNTL